MNQIYKDAKLNYVLTKSEHTDNDAITYPVYGIGLLAPVGTTTLIQDISSKEEIVCKMVEMFNVCQLPTDRLIDAIVPLLP